MSACLCCGSIPTLEHMQATCEQISKHMQEACLIIQQGLDDELNSLVKRVVEERCVLQEGKGTLRERDPGVSTTMKVNAV